MNTASETQPVPETKSRNQSDPQHDTDQQTIAEHLGPTFRITPIGFRRFRCNRYACPNDLYPTGRLAESFLLRVTSTGIERVSDRVTRPDRVRPVVICRLTIAVLSRTRLLANTDRSRVHRRRWRHHQSGAELAG